MPQLTEQERLASLVGRDDKEPVATGDLLEESLRSQLGPVDAHRLAKTTQDIEAYGDVAISVKQVGAQSKQPQINAYSEKVLITSYEIRDSLIECFESTELNSDLSHKLTEQIQKLGSNIIHMGGSVDTFEPLNHVSGLQMPDVIKNAEEVIERTIQCYRLGNIKEAKIKDDGREINIQFEGKAGDTTYVASGRIIASGWTGNEAIDYVYTPREGKMTVKAFEGGRWVNKSENNENYRVSWELIENDISKESAELSPDKEEFSPDTQNNQGEDYSVSGEEDISSPIK